jgi:hypothetical protein
LRAVRAVRAVRTAHHTSQPQSGTVISTRVMTVSTVSGRRITIPMKVGPSTPFPGFASAIEVRENSRFEKYRPNVKIETTPDERRVLNAAHLASIALRRTFDHPVLGEVYDE